MFQNVQLSSQLSSCPVWAMIHPRACPAYLALVLQQVMRKERIGWTGLQQEPPAQVDTWLTNEDSKLQKHSVAWYF